MYTSLELLEKEGIVSFGIPINIATVDMEDIYKRMCWLYITVKNTIVYDHIGNAYHQSYQRERFHIQSSSLINLIMSRNHYFRTFK